MNLPTRTKLVLGVARTQSKLSTQTSGVLLSNTLQCETTLSESPFHLSVHLSCARKWDVAKKRGIEHLKGQET